MCQLVTAGDGDIMALRHRPWQQAGAEKGECAVVGQETTQIFLQCLQNNNVVATDPRGQQQKRHLPHLQTWLTRHFQVLGKCFIERSPCIDARPTRSTVSDPAVIVVESCYRGDHGLTRIIAHLKCAVMGCTSYKAVCFVFCLTCWLC